MTLAEAVRDAAIDALIAAKGNKRAAARILDCNVRTLYNIMARNGIATDFGRKPNIPVKDEHTPVRLEHSAGMPVDWRDVGPDRPGA